MNVNELIHKICEIALSQDTIKSVYNGDVYDNWNSAEVNYGSLNIGLQNITYNEQLCTYSFIFYYGDRLLQDKKNINAIFTDGVNSIQAVVNLLNKEDTIQTLLNLNNSYASIARMLQVDRSTLTRFCKSRGINRYHNDYGTEKWDASRF